MSSSSLIFATIALPAFLCSAASAQSATEDPNRHLIQPNPVATALGFPAIPWRTLDSVAKPLLLSKGYSPVPGSPDLSANRSVLNRPAVVTFGFARTDNWSHATDLTDIEVIWPAPADPRSNVEWFNTVVVLIDSIANARHESWYRLPATDVPAPYHEVFVTWTGRGWKGPNLVLNDSGSVRLSFRPEPRQLIAAAQRDRLDLALTLPVSTSDSSDKSGPLFLDEACPSEPPTLASIQGQRLTVDVSAEGYPTVEVPWNWTADSPQAAAARVYERWLRSCPIVPALTSGGHRVEGSMEVTAP